MSTLLKVSGLANPSEPTSYGCFDLTEELYRLLTCRGCALRSDAGDGHPTVKIVFIRENDNLYMENVMRGPMLLTAFG